MSKRFIVTYRETHIYDCMFMNSVITFNDPINRKVIFTTSGKKPINMWADDDNRIDIPYDLKLHENFYLEYDIYVEE
jgi:hypothetical protein